MKIKQLMSIIDTHVPLETVRIGTMLITYR